MEIKNVGHAESAAQGVRDLAASAAKAPVDKMKKVESVKEIAPSAEAKAADEKNLRAAVDKINRFIDSNQSAITFSLDKDTGLTVVKVIDTENNAVIRQIPSEEAIEIAKSLDKNKSVILKTSA